MREWEIAFLRKLRDASADGVTESSIPKRCHAIANALRACGAADYLPSAAGRGIRLRIKSETSFARFVDSRCPSGLDIDPSEIQSHSDAIVHLGDAKAFNRPIAEGVFVRATKPNITIQSAETGDTIPVSKLTAVNTVDDRCRDSEEAWPRGLQLAYFNKSGPSSFTRYDGGIGI